MFAFFLDIIPNSKDVVEFVKTQGFINAFFAALGVLGTQLFRYLSVRKTTSVEKQKEDDALTIRDRKDFTDQQHALLAQRDLEIAGYRKELEDYREENRLLRSDIAAAIDRANSSELQNLELKSKMMAFTSEMALYQQQIEDFKTNLTKSVKNTIE